MERRDPAGKKARKYVKNLMARRGINLAPRKWQSGNVIISQKAAIARVSSSRINFFSLERTKPDTTRNHSGEHRRVCFANEEKESP